MIHAKTTRLNEPDHSNKIADVDEDYFTGNFKNNNIPVYSDFRMIVHILLPIPPLSIRLMQFYSRGNSMWSKDL